MVLHFTEQAKEDNHKTVFLLSSKISPAYLEEIEVILLCLLGKMPHLNIDLVGVLTVVNLCEVAFLWIH